MKFLVHLSRWRKFALRALCALQVVVCDAQLLATEVEPNNSRQQANPLRLSPTGVASVNGRISSLGDLDYFSVTTPASAGPGTLAVTMTPTSLDRQLDARLELLSTNGGVLMGSDEGFDGSPETITYDSAAGNTTYYVVCSSADFFSAGVGEYSLRVEWISPKPNLTWYQPDGWTDALVVSKRTGTFTDTPDLTTTNLLYVDLAFANLGALATDAPFQIDLWVDGVVSQSWVVPDSLPMNTYLTVIDHPLGRLPAGRHILSLVLDPAAHLSESEETDNDISKAIFVVDDDPDDQLADAPDLGAVHKTLTSNGSIASPTDVNLVAFSVVAGQRVSFNLNDAEGWDPYLRLFDRNGVQLASNDDGAGPGESPTLESYLEFTFESSGAYFAGVSGAGNENYNPVTGSSDAPGSTGSYRLVISPGVAGRIRVPGSPGVKELDLLRSGTVPMRVNASQQTWLVIHGWNSTRDEEKVLGLTKAISQSQPEDQVLTLDWSEAADTGILDPMSAENAIIPVAEWAAAALEHVGFSGANLNLVGHSFGSYIADEIAKRMPGGVHTIITLDPAADVAGGFSPTLNDGIDFARDSFFSWSFHSSSAGNEQAPTTADEAFIVESGLSTPTAHRNVVLLFAYMILHPNEAISRLFRLSSLLSGTPGPWVPDQFTSSFLIDEPVKGYEAILTSTDLGRSPSHIEFVPFPALSISTTADGLAISWPASDTQFVLESSALAAAAVWTDVEATPVNRGQAKVVFVRPSGTSQFFRLTKP